MFNNPYMTNYNNSLSQQNIMERIDNQISQLQGMKEQIKSSSVGQQNHQPAINQTFQLAPNSNGGIKYVNSIDDVVKENVFVDTPFFSKDLSVLWVKNATGEIKAYELNEIVKKDEKDLQIEFLTAKISELEGMIKNEQPTTNVINEQNATNTSTNGETNGEPIKEDKSTSVSRVSKSKKEQ